MAAAPLPTLSGALPGSKRADPRGGQGTVALSRSLYLAKLFATFPFTEENGSLQISRFFPFYSLFVIAGCVSLEVIGFSDPEPSARISSLAGYLDYTQVTLVIITYALAIPVGMYHLPKLNSVLHQLESVDVSLSSIGMVFKYEIKGEVIRATLSIVCLIGLAALEISIYQVVNLYTVAIWLTYYVPAMAMDCISRQFTVMVDFIWAHLKFVVKNLLSTAKATPYPGREGKLETLAEAHDALCSSAWLFNQAFSFQLLAIISSVFIVVTFNAYTIVQMATSISTKSFTVIGAIDIFLTVYWIGHYGNISWRIVTSSSRAMDEAKNFNTFLYQLMLDDRNNEIADNKKLRLHISMKRDIEFTASGFFTLDYTLIHSMIAAATTYLVILIQFGQPSAETENTNGTKST